MYICACAYAGAAMIANVVTDLTADAVANCGYGTKAVADAVTIAGANEVIIASANAVQKQCESDMEVVRLQCEGGMETVQKQCRSK